MNAGSTPSADPSPSRPTVVAVFDFDGTLTVGDSVVPFLRRFSRRWAVLPRAFREATAVAAAAARRDRDRLRLAATRAVLAGVPMATVTETGHRFAAEIVAGRLRPDTVARLAWHRREGHRVVIVSASYEVYLHDVAEHLGVEAVLATRLAESADGRCTGGLDGPNCRAAEKVTRLHAWLRQQGLSRDEVSVWAYGDSPGDRELLADADHPVWARAPLASVAAFD